MDEIDAQIVARIRKNHADYRAAVGGKVNYAEWAGVLEVNVDELLKVIERLTRPALSPCLQSWPDHNGSLRRCQRPTGHDGLHQDGTAYCTADYVRDHSHDYTGRHRMAGA